MYSALLLSAAASAAHAFRSPLSAAPPALRARIASHPAATHAPLAAFAPGVRCSPLDYGGDPLGVRDSSDAIAACVSSCVNYSVTIDALGHFPGDASFGNGLFIANAGGCQVDLGGGAFLVAKPILIPAFVGNMALGHGSIVADPAAFPQGEFLVVVGEKGACNVPQGSCNVDLNFPELMLDGRHVAAGLQINNVMGTTVGPGNYFLNFTGFGIQINGGHEVLIDRMWLGETNFDYPFTATDLPNSM